MATPIQRSSINEALTVLVRTEAASRSTSSHCAVIIVPCGRPAMNGASADQAEGAPKA